MDIRPIASLSTDLAVANIGVQEVGENRGKAVEAYQASCKPPVPAGSPWCAAHVRFRHKQAATQLGIVYDETFPRSAYCPDWSRWFKNSGLWLPVQHIRDTGKAVLVERLETLARKHGARFAPDEGWTDLDRQD